MLLRIFDMFDWINNTLGRVFSWLVGALIMTQFSVVLLRYVFGVGSIKLQESIIYIHAFILMMLCGYTLLKEGHVRLDLIYNGCGPKARALLDIFGVLVYLVPMCVFIFFGSQSYVLRSWSVLESSREVSGLPGVFLLKTMIMCFAFLLFIQAMSLLGRAVFTLTNLNTDTESERTS